MAKVSYLKLKLTSNLLPKELKWGDQVIEVKQYISMQDKLNMVADILNAAADDNKFYNPGKLDLFFCLYVIYNYTNLSITEKQKENFVKLYDDLMSSGFYHEVFKTIPEDEVGYVYTLMKETADQIYKYNNSAYGILDAMNTDYDNLNFDIQKIMGDIQNKEGVEFLNDVMTKLG